MQSPNTCGDTGVAGGETAFPLATGGDCKALVGEEAAFADAELLLNNGYLSPNSVHLEHKPF